MTLLGISFLRQGRLEEAKNTLLKSTGMSHLHLDVKPIAFNALGEVYLNLGDWEKARKYFADASSTSRGNSYYIIQSMLGILRIEFLTSKSAELEHQASQIETLSLEHGYNNLLAQIYFAKGYMSWADNSLSDHEQEASIAHFRKSLIYALRYNRFLLDEVLSERPQCTPLRPIIPYCLEHGEEGRRMLIALGDWWKTGVNDIGAPRSDTISPIPEGIPLLEAERIAREREPGDGSPQKSVVEQIEAALEAQ